MRLKKLSFRLQSYCHFIVISVMINNIYFISRNYCLECSSDIKLGKLDISFHVFLSIFSVRCSDFPSVKSFWAFHRDFWRAALSLNYMTPQSACQHNLSFLDCVEFASVSSERKLTFNKSAFAYIRYSRMQFIFVMTYDQSRTSKFRGHAQLSERKKKLNFSSVLFIYAKYTSDTWYSYNLQSNSFLERILL